MLNYLNNHFNETRTANGAFAYKSTNSAVLDLFSQGAAMRTRNAQAVVELFSKAYNEKPLLAMKTLFYLRDARQGQGERRFFRLCLKHLALHHKKSLIKNLYLIPEFGRWDDLWVLLETGVKAEVASLVEHQLLIDKHAEKPSLLGKWMPSANVSSPTTKKHANTLIKLFGTTPRKYRKLISSLRAKINLVETKLTEKNYPAIEYDKLPSKAGMVYRKAFFRNDEERYKAFLDSLSKGEKKVNASTLYPNDIVGKILAARWGWNVQRLTEQDIQLFEGQWQNLPNYIGDNEENSIVMADVSGSMSGTPMNVSIALAMYIAERNKGAYHNHFMTFSARPQLVKIQGKDIVEKVMNISQAEWGMNTNIESALQTILDVAVKNRLSNDEVVKKIIIVSDMAFDRCTKGADVHIFKDMERRFHSHGYTMPNIIFWNVNAHGNTPMQMNDYGVQLVSGFSPSIMTQLLNADGKTPYDFMLDVINSDRYEMIVV